MQFIAQPFQSAIEYQRMIDYFLDGGDSFLLGMGVDLTKLPTREAWPEAALTDHVRDDHDKDRFYLAWLRDTEQVGHSSISHIQPLEIANVHLHLWRPERAGEDSERSSSHAPSTSTSSASGCNGSRPCPSPTTPLPIGL